jgi:hypothetical protein
MPHTGIISPENAQITLEARNGWKYNENSTLPAMPEETALSSGEEQGRKSSKWT